MIKGSESDKTLLKGLLRIRLSEAQRAKKLVPWKTNLGISNLAARLVAHGKNISATRQLGRSSCRRFSTGSWSITVALTKP